MFYRKTTIVLICGQLMRHPLTELFHLSNLFQMPNDHRMVDAKFFGIFLYSYKRIIFSDCFQLVAISFQWPATAFSSLSLSAPLLSVLSRHCTVHSLAVSGPDALLMRIVAAALRPISNSLRKSLEFAF